MVDLNVYHSNNLISLLLAFLSSKILLLGTAVYGDMEYSELWRLVSPLGCPASRLRKRCQMPLGFCCSVLLHRLAVYSLTHPANTRPRLVTPSTV